MKYVIRMLRDHLRKDFHAGLYGYTAVFLAITISINYHLDFEDSILDTYFGSLKGVVYNILFFMTAYYGIAIPQALFTGNASRLASPRYWAQSFIMIALVGFVSGFYGHSAISGTFPEFYDRNFVYRIGDFMKPLVILIPMMAVALLFDFKGDFYGLLPRRFNHRPYWMMLLFMVPLIAAASFFEDFQHTYPRYKPWHTGAAFDWPFWKMGLVYEVAYGLNLLFTEYMFRGMLVVGLARILGKDAILPMVAAYAFLHFGKPLFETLGSIFGGYILGVIALNSRNIWGGIWIHMGVAWLMEIAAYLQHAYRGFQ